MSTFLEDTPGFTRLPETNELSEPSKALAEEVRASGATDFVHVGGSALGPIALHPYYNLLADRGGPASTSPRTRTPRTSPTVTPLDVHPSVFSRPDGRVWMRYPYVAASDASRRTEWLRRKYKKSVFGSSTIST